MKIIVVSKHHGNTLSFTFGWWARVLLLFGALFLAVLVFRLSSQIIGQSNKQVVSEKEMVHWASTLAEQQEDIEKTKEEAEYKLAALTLRVAELQARLVRLDALGERLTTMAKLDKGEFDFSQAPALGGPEENMEDPSLQSPSFNVVLDQLTERVIDRQQQLETLEALLANRKIQSDVFIAGRPIKKGWMSSRYGRRADPFTGRVAWHAGVDFAGKDGADIVAVASGVVTWADDRYGYGNLVEINHGNGFKTRYGHCKELLVKVGEVVKKGQIIAYMGSSGRSTGPHVHFEVFKNGKSVNPASYIHRAHR